MKFDRMCTGQKLGLFLKIGKAAPICWEKQQDIRESNLHLPQISVGAVQTNQLKHKFLEGLSSLGVVMWELRVSIAGWQWSVSKQAGKRKLAGDQSAGRRARAFMLSIIAVYYVVQAGGQNINILQPDCDDVLIRNFYLLYFQQRRWRQTFQFGFSKTKASCEVVRSSCRIIGRLRIEFQFSKSV